MILYETMESDVEWLQPQIVVIYKYVLEVASNNIRSKACDPSLLANRHKFNSKIEMALLVFFKLF